MNLDKFLEDIQTIVHDGEELLKVGASGLKERTIAGARSADQFVRSYPYRTLGIIFGVGFLAGLLAAGSWISRSEEVEPD